MQLNLYFRSELLQITLALPIFSAILGASGQEMILQQELNKVIGILEPTIQLKKV